MNNKEAISKLRQIKNYYHFESYAKDLDYKIEALDLAIKALENERPHGECPYYDGKCDYYNFVQTFIDGIVKVMNENHISSVEELVKIIGGNR